MGILLTAVKIVVVVVFSGDIFKFVKSKFSTKKEVTNVEPE